MARLNITVPDDLYKRAEKWRDRINLSRVCQEAIRRELDKLEQVPEQLREMREALSRLEREKAKIERSCFRKGVYDGLEWARGADYASLKRWGEQPATAEALEEVLHGPAARSAAVHHDDPGWEPRPYAEGWIAGVNQFWERAKNHL